METKPINGIIKPWLFIGIINDCHQKALEAPILKRGKLKILGYSLLTIAIIAAGAIAYAYKQLQPQNHFKTVPVVNSNNTKDSQTSE